MNRRMQVASAFLTALWVLSIFLVRPAYAAQDDCRVDVGKKMPVLFVHGFNSDEGVWGKKQDRRSFIGTVNSTSGLHGETFGYRAFSLQWVTNPQIGMRLATKILCLAELSRKSGGQGKVVVVAHSMGGLATRQAIAENPAIAKVLGLVITIGTPNFGSEVDYKLSDTIKNLCMFNPSTALGCRASLVATLEVLTALPGLAADSKEIRRLPM